MALKLGYLLPTREQIMDGRPEAAPLLSLAERAERLGYDSIWVGGLSAGAPPPRAPDIACRRRRPYAPGAIRHGGFTTSTA